MHEKHAGETEQDTRAVNRNKLGENNRELNARKTLMVEEASLTASKFLTFSLKKNNNKFYFSSITK